MVNNNELLYTQIDHYLKVYLLQLIPNLGESHPVPAQALSIYKIAFTCTMYITWLQVLTLSGLFAVAGGESWELEEMLENGKGGRLVRCI